jgi:predicted SAM-dependent methyltransferase
MKTLKKIKQELKSKFNLYQKNKIFRQELNDFIKLSRISSRNFKLDLKNLYLCLDDKSCETSFDRHYVYHTAWAARIINELKPTVHHDISSSLYFCSIVSAFYPIKFYDYRPANLNLSNLSSESADLLNLPFADNSIESLSCMHVIEHVGLGRYGDPLDPDGDLKAIEELKRVLAIGGSLLFVVPVGKPRIMFNAHRIYSYGQIVEYFSDLYLKQFALIPDDFKDGGLVESAPETIADEQNYGCGCFWFIKQ